MYKTYALSNKENEIYNNMFKQKFYKFKKNIHTTQKNLPLKYFQSAFTKPRIHRMYLLLLSIIKYPYRVYALKFQHTKLVRLYTRHTYAYLHYIQLRIITPTYFQNR